MRKFTIALLGTLFLSLAVVSAAVGADAKEETGDPYTLETCPVSGQKLGSMGDPVVKEYDGREVRFCCKGCVEPFEKDQAKYWKKIDAAMVEDQKDYFPTNMCVVMGVKNDQLGDPIDFVHNNRLFRLCCERCKTAVADSPAEYFKKVDELVVEAQKEGYPLEKCPVSGQKLGSMRDPVDIVVANRLIRLCCQGCEAKVREEPLKYLSKLEEAE